MKEVLLFLRVALSRPLGVGSLVPSTAELADRLTGRIPWEKVKTVVELGAGTGSLSSAVMRRKPPGVKFLAFEREPLFREYLAKQFPGLQLHPEAHELGRVLLAEGIPHADVIISGIPFAALPLAEQESLLDEIHRALAPGGQFVAFQYSLLLRRRLLRRFDRVELDVTWANLPPAVIYRCFKETATERSPAPSAENLPQT